MEYRRRTHETCSQDRDSDRRFSRYICSGSRPTGSRPGRRPAYSVPTQRLWWFPRKVIPGRPVWQVTKVTCRNWAKSKGLQSSGWWTLLTHRPLFFARASVSRATPLPTFFAVPQQRKPVADRQIPSKSRQTIWRTLPAEDSELYLPGRVADFARWPDPL